MATASSRSSGLPGGTHTLEARAVGFMPARTPVDIVQGTPGATEVELTNFGITLDTVRVFGAAPVHVEA